MSEEKVKKGGGKMTTWIGKWEQCEPPVCTDGGCAPAAAPVCSFSVLVTLPGDAGPKVIKDVLKRLGAGSYVKITGREGTLSYGTKTVDTFAV